MDVKTRFRKLYPDAFFLEHQPSDELTGYLRGQRWIGPQEVIVSVDKPGEGNMNAVARVTTSHRSLVLKQAYPWACKFPQVAAPLDRGKMEAIFYQLIEDDTALRSFTPTMIGFDSQSHILAQEDLGEGLDFTFLYDESACMTEEQLTQLLRFLSHLHRIRASPDEARSLENRAMRKLNHEHIFRYPFVEDNGSDLDTVLPGLTKAAQPYRQNTILLQRIEALGQLYLQDGDTLVHGDYYPGSWLRVDRGVRVIDPEFGFFGRAEFDVGVMLAHTLLTNDSTYTAERIVEGYQAPDRFDLSLTRAFAGVEVLRRLIGLAQLPISLSLEQREALMQKAAKML